jgi:hypothetical protein
MKLSLKANKQFYKAIFYWLKQPTRQYTEVFFYVQFISAKIGSNDWGQLQHTVPKAMDNFIVSNEKKKHSSY